MEENNKQEKIMQGGQRGNQEIQHKEKNQIIKKKVRWWRHTVGIARKNKDLSNRENKPGKKKSKLSYP